MNSLYDGPQKELLRKQKFTFSRLEVNTHQKHEREKVWRPQYDFELEICRKIDTEERRETLYNWLLLSEVEASINMKYYCFKVAVGEAA